MKPVSADDVKAAEAFAIFAFVLDAAVLRVATDVVKFACTAVFDAKTARAEVSVVVAAATADDSEDRLAAAVAPAEMPVAVRADVTADAKAELVANEELRLDVAEEFAVVSEELVASAAE